MDSKNENSFKFTKIWNELIYSFFMEIPVKKHLKNMRYHENTFVASKAVNWVLNYLENNTQFNHQKINRSQAIQLMRKFKIYGVIEKVNSKDDNTEFNDNRDLYRFNSSLIRQIIRDMNGNHDRKSSKQSDIHQISWSWKSIILNELKKFIPYLDELIDLSTINPFTIWHNGTRISKHGVVIVADKTEDYPQWIMSAMKCLVNWPLAYGADNCLPKYDGFEQDVFNLIKEYIFNFERPMIPSNFYKLIITLFDMNFKNNPKSTNNDQIESNNQNEKSDEELQLNHIFETEFIGGSPKTKLVSLDELAALFQSSDISEKLTKHEKESELNTQRFYNGLATLPRTARRRKTKDFGLQVNGTFNRRHKYKADPGTLTCMDTGFFMSPNEDGEYMFEKSLNEIKSDLHVQDGNETNFCKSLQLILLLIPSSNRRHLHIFFKFLSRLEINDQLKLNFNGKIKRDFLSDTFCRYILHPGNERNYDQNKCKQIINLILDHFEFIFMVPQNVKLNVEKHKLYNQYSVQGKENESSQGLNFCEKISEQEYIKQAKDMTNIELLNLFHFIFTGNSIKNHEKMKRIKEFKDFHPEIYQEYFKIRSHDLPSRNHPSHRSFISKIFSDIRV